MIRAKFVNVRPMSGIVRVTVDIKPEQYSQFNAMLDDFHIGLSEPPSAPKAAAPPLKKDRPPKAPPAPTPLEAAIAVAAPKAETPIVIVNTEPEPAPVYKGTGDEIDGHPIAQRNTDSEMFVYINGLMIPLEQYKASRPVDEPTGSVFDDDSSVPPSLQHAAPQAEAVSDYETRRNPEDAPPEDELEIPDFLKRNMEPSGSVFDEPSDAS